MDPNVCRDHFASLLAEEAGMLGELEELLQREHEVLESKDVQALERTAKARQERIGALARIEEQCRSLCRLHGYSADRTGLEQLLAWCDPKGSLMSRLRECSERATRCREYNDRNGTMVVARLRRVEGQLAILTGRTTRPDTYSQRGYASNTRPSRVLGAA
jgi:flagellar biosynthesis/type III secretory pathway chaperone